MNEQIRKNNSSTKEENQSKKWAQEKCTTFNNKSGFCTSPIPTNGISTLLLTMLLLLTMFSEAKHI